MKQGLEYLRVILRCGYEMAFAYIVMVYFTIIFAKQNVDMGQTITLAILFCVSYILRDNVENRMILTGVHIAMAAVTLIMPYAFVIRLFWAVLITAFLLTGSLKQAGSVIITPYLDSVPWAGMLFCVIFYLFGLLSGEKGLENSAYVILIIMLMMSLARLYVDGVCKYMSQTHNMDGISVNTMLKTNTRLVAAVMTGMLVVMLISGVTGLTAAVGRMIMLAATYLGRGLTFVMSFIMNLLERLFSKTRNNEDILKDAFLNAVAADGNDTSMLANVLMVLLLALFGILLIAIAAKLIKKAVWYLMQKRYYIVNKDSKSSGVSVTIEHIDKKPEMIKKTVSTPEERFRKCYKNEIQRYGREIRLNEYMTCDDIQDRISSQGLGDVEEINILYKSVRYGNIDADKHSIKKLKSLIGENKGRN